MALTKFHLTYAIAQQNGFNRKKSLETVETILEIIKSTTVSGEDVMISGFGKFCVKINKFAEEGFLLMEEGVIIAPMGGDV